MSCCQEHDHVSPLSGARWNATFTCARMCQEVCECVFLVFRSTRLRMVYYISMVSNAVHRSTSQVDTRGPTSPLTETPSLLAPNVSDCAEVVSLPSFTVQGVIGFHDSSFQNVMKCGVYTRKDLYANAVFSGGTRLLVNETYDSAVL